MQINDYYRHKVRLKKKIATERWKYSYQIFTNKSNLGIK